MLDMIIDVPALVKVFGSLGIIIIASRWFKRLFAPMLIGIIVLAMWSGHSVKSTGAVVFGRIYDWDNLFLLLTMAEVIILSDQMSRTGAIRQLVAFVRSRVSRRVAMAALPAVIGFLPMPGGALFSAPLVDDCDEKRQLSHVLKAQVNYWFRHVWEYWWPLYPGVLLAVDCSGLSIGWFMMIQFPMCLVSLVAGWFFMLRKIPEGGRERHGECRVELVLTRVVAPIASLLLLAFTLRIVFPGLLVISRFLPMVIGVFFACVLLQLIKPLDKATWRHMVFSKSILNLLVLVALIRVYGAFIVAETPMGDTLVGQIRTELFDYGIPLVIVIMIIPFVTGLATGIAVGFVGASFPIVFSLLGDSPSFSTLLATTLLAFAFGYMGMILSPVHVCLIVTNEHFKAPLWASLLPLWRPATVILGAATLAYWCIINFC